MESEIRKLRAALARRESGRGRRFAPDLRHQIAGVGRRLRDDGVSWSRIGAALGLPMATAAATHVRRGRGGVARQLTDRHPRGPVSGKYSACTVQFCVETSIASQTQMS